MPKSQPQPTGRVLRPSANPTGDPIVAAAADLFSERSFDGATTREIVARAGVTRPLLNYHFRSKEDLFATVHAEGFRQVNAAMDRELKGTTDPWKRLEAAIAAHLGELVKHTDVSGVTTASLFHAVPASLQRRLNRERSLYEDRFRALIAALRLPPDVDQSLLRLTLLGAINWTRTWYRPGKRTPAQLAQHLVNKILRTRL